MGNCHLNIPNTELIGIGCTSSTKAEVYVLLEFDTTTRFKKLRAGKWYYTLVYGQVNFLWYIIHKRSGLPK